MVSVRSVLSCGGRGAALLAVEFRADAAAPALGGDDPRPVDPWRAMPHVLRVPALEIRDPVVSLVFVKTYNPSFHDSLFLTL